MTTARSFRLELSYNWDRLAEGNVYFLDHYCVAYKPATGHAPVCSTFLQFTQNDQLEVFIFNRGFTTIAQNAQPKKLSFFFKQATELVGSVSTVYGNGSPINAISSGEASFDLAATAPNAEKSWAFPSVTPTTWYPVEASGATQNPFVLDNSGFYLFRAVLEVEDPDHPGETSYHRQFSFDPEMVVGEGTGGSPAGF